MQALSHAKFIKAIVRPVRYPVPRPVTPTWKPQVPNLTRDEMREIVIDLIG